MDVSGHMSQCGLIVRSSGIMRRSRRLIFYSDVCRCGPGRNVFGENNASSIASKRLLSGGNRTEKTVRIDGDDAGLHASLYYVSRWAFFILFQCA